MIRRCSEPNQNVRQIYDALKLCICKKLNNTLSINLILISTKHVSNKIFNVTGDKTTVVIPAF